MMFVDAHKSSHNHGAKNTTLWQTLHIDVPLLVVILLLCIVGLFILYSASNQNMRMVQYQALHVGAAFALMIFIAQIPPLSLQRWAPALYVLGLLLLIAVLITGHVGKGAQRWLGLGFFRFQPAELMKLALPMGLAWYFHKVHLPIHLKNMGLAIPLLLLPVLLTAKQPDLSTAILLFIAGSSVLFLAGLSWRFITATIGIIIVCAPAAWFMLHSYQRQRVITFFNPERDPLGAGYHIIQSKIAIGSGGIFGKGWLQGTQSHLQFLPEHTTDFIFSLCGEELGFIGCFMIISLYLLIVARGFYITLYAQDTFSRLVAGSITLSFFISFFINIGMVTGVLPVMGIPLPLISYGGSSMMTLMASFGILMSIQTHKRLITT